MESHKKVLGILFIVLASFQLLFMLLLNFIFTSIFTFAMSQSDPDDARVIEIVMDVLRYLPALIILFFAIPSLIAGFGLLSKKSWAMIMALILGCINILSFPFGTAIGIYAIWIYSTENKMAKAAAANP